MSLTNFLSLPRELRQTILLLAIKSSMVREWRIVTVAVLLPRRRVIRGGIWNDNGADAFTLLATIKELYERDINIDLKWGSRVIHGVSGGLECLRTVCFVIFSANMKDALAEGVLVTFLLIDGSNRSSWHSWITCTLPTKRPNGFLHAPRG